MPNSKVYEIIQKEIIEKLDKGIIPWKKTWSSQEPMNYITKRQYTGYNQLILSCSEYTSPYWLTFKQAKKLQKKIKKGEKGQLVIYWNIIEKQSKKDETKTEKIPFLKYYRLFNTEQIEDLKIKEQSTEEIKNPILQCEEIVNNYKTIPTIKTSNNQQPLYNAKTDTIKMPPINNFNISEEYYSVLFHEMVHSTNHKSRLNRKENYAKEELIAEIGSAFLCSKAKIKTKVIDNQISYIKLWKDTISSDPNLIISASSMSSKAVNFILNKV